MSTSTLFIITSISRKINIEEGKGTEYAAHMGDVRNE
jgi:hypothetical protein